MKKQRQNHAETLFIGFASIVAITAVLLIGTWFRSDEQPLDLGRQGDAGVEVSNPSLVRTVIVSTMAENSMEVTTSPSPEGEPLWTVDQAIEHAVMIAESYLKAENPTVADAEIMTLAEALATSALALGENPELAIEDQPADAASMPVWRIVLTGTSFEIPKCPAPADLSITSHSCGTGFEAAITLSAIDGEFKQLVILTDEGP